MKRRRVSKDKKTKIPKKYLSGLKGGKRSARASLLRLCQKHIKKDREYQNQCLLRGINNGC